MEKIKKFMNTLKFKWLRDTLATAIVVAVLVAVFVGINILVGIWDPSDIDMTDEGLYSLTDESKQIISSLPEEDKFQIYMFDYEEENTLIDFLKEYTRINDNITLEVVKSEDRPDLVSKYDVLENYGSVVVVSGERNLTFNYYDFYNYDMETGAYSDITEQRFTNSIVGLSSIGEHTIIYELTGHDEIGMQSGMTVLKTYLELENYEIKQLDLLTAMNVPEDCDTLLVASPTKDITELEAEAIKSYINKGGNILWLNNPYSSENDTPNLDSVLSLYGVKVRKDGVILEQDSSKMVLNAPDFILPAVNPTEITSEISNVLLFDSGKLEIVDNNALTELGCQKTDLLISNPSAFFRTDLSRGFYGISEGESTEEAILACLMEKSVENGEKTSEIIVVANNLFAQDELIPVGSRRVSAIGLYKNMDFTLNCISHLTDVDDKMIIRKDIETVPYTATESQDTIIKTIIFTVPVLIIIAGIIVWNIRKRKK